MASSIDPRDSIVPGQKEWEEYRASLASVLLQAWLLEELPEVAPDYFTHLEERFDIGLLNADALAADDPQYDGAVPVQGPRDRDVTFFGRSDAEALYGLLFPHGTEQPESDTLFLARGLTVVGLQACLEAYATALGVDVTHDATAKIRAFLRERTSTDLDATTSDHLTDCEATRHLFAHHRGVVDERYIRRVPNCGRVIDDRREVDLETFQRFTTAVHRAATRLRDATTVP